MSENVDKTSKPRLVHVMSQNKSKSWWDKIFAENSKKPSFGIVKKPEGEK